MKAIVLKICIIWLVLVLSGCMATDQYRALENRVNALEMDNTRLKARQTQFHDQAAVLSAAMDDLETKVQAIEQTSRENIAEINQELHRLHRKHGELQGMVEETDFRVRRTDPVRPGIEPALPDTDPVDPVLPVSDKEAYEQAKKTFDEGDMETARSQFEKVISMFPDSAYAGNARFWIADSHYVEKWYEKAILEYQKVLEQYPDSNKVAAARLKQGYAFAELGENANARLILNELLNRYPDTPEAGLAREKLNQLQ